MANGFTAKHYAMQTVFWQDDGDYVCEGQESKGRGQELAL